MTKFGDLVPGDVFIAQGSGVVYIKPSFDIFANDRIIRTRRDNAGHAVVLSGRGAGKWDGVFRDSDPVELVKLEASLWTREGQPHE